MPNRTKNTFKITCILSFTDVYIDYTHTNYRGFGGRDINRGRGKGGIKLLYPPISNYLVVHIAELSLSWLVDHSS